MSRRRKVSQADAEAVGTLVALAFLILVAAARYGWPLIPAVIAFAIGHDTPVAGVVITMLAAFSILGLFLARRSGWSAWKMATAHPVIAALLTAGPLFAAPMGIRSGIVDRAEQAERQAAEIREYNETQRRAFALAEAQRAAVAVREEEERQAAARAAAREAARTPSDRAAAVLAALRSGDREGARQQLEAVPEVDRCDHEVLGARRAMHAAEMADWRESRRSLLAGRMALCADGDLSPTCECDDIHQGCCSHHGGVAGCEHVDIPPPPTLSVHCNAPARPVARAEANAGNGVATAAATSASASAPQTPTSGSSEREREVVDPNPVALDTHHTCYRADGTPQRVPIAVRCTALHYTDDPPGAPTAGWVHASAAGE